MNRRKEIVMNRRIISILLSLVMVLTLVGVSIGCAKPTAESNPILVGCPGSWAAQPWALGGRYGQELAVDEINAAGGVNVGGVMRPFELVEIDTRDEEAGVPVSESLLGIEKLILQDKVDVICGGPSMSEASMAVIDLVSKYHILDIVSYGTWTPSWGKKVGEDIVKYGCSFRMSHNVAILIPAAVDILNEMAEEYGFEKKAYIVIQDTMFCRNAMDVFAGLAEKSGWEVLGQELCPQGTTDYSPALMKVKNSGAPVMLIWTNDPTATIMMRQFIDLEVPAVPIGFCAAAQEHEVYEAVGGKCEYIIFPSADAAVTSTKFPEYVEFQKDYEEKFNKEPFGEAGSGYTTMYVLKQAIERAGSLDTDALITAMEQTDYMGLNGRVRFNKDNHEQIYSDDPNEGEMPAYSQWIGGKRVCIWPAAVADSKIVLPPWMKQ